MTTEEVEALGRLLQNAPELITAKDNTGNTLLHTALRSRQTQATKLLLEKGADVHAKNNVGFTPLHFGASVGTADLVSLLLDKGANVNARANNGQTPLYLAAEGGHLETVRTLLARGADMNMAANDGTTPLSIATTNSRAVAALLLEKGALPDQVVFAVIPNRYDPGFIIDPVVILRGGRYLPPPVPSLGDASDASARFTATYYKPGMTYRLLSGGGGAGVVTVVEHLTGYSGTSLVAQIQKLSTVKLGGAVFALAVDTPSLRIQAPSRRGATPVERKAMVALARQVFRQKGAPAADLSRIQVLNLTGMDTDRDGKTEMIGTFSARGRKALHELFLIARSRGAHLASALVSYHRASDVTDGTDSAEELLVDQLDLDGDGVAEIITKTEYYESWDYRIYGRRSGTWRRLYHGGGGGS